MTTFSQRQVQNLVPDLAARALVTTKIVAGLGLTGGGTLAADRSLALTGVSAAIAGLAGTGFLASTAAGAASQRTLTGSSGRISVTNGTGSAGNPVFDLVAISGLTAGSATKVTFDGYGRITGASNPTTLAGYGITDAIGGLGGTIAGVLEFNASMDLDIPVYNAKSVGTRLLLQQARGVGSVDFAVGMNTNRMWFSIPSPSSGQDFAFYAGQNLVLKIDGTGAATLSGAFRAATKSFLIPHPTRRGMVLEHGSLEGPEHAVYVRGRAAGTSLPLPAYWSKLVDWSSITVHLTPRGPYHVWAGKVGPRSIRICSNVDPRHVEFDYWIVAARRDVAPLAVERRAA